MLALLLALAGTPDRVDDLNVLLISLTHGNVEVHRSDLLSNQARKSLINRNESRCLRNVVALFHVLEQELKWRLEKGSFGGFQSLKDAPPLVAVGAECPLGDQLMLADYFRKAASSQLSQS